MLTPQLRIVPLESIKPHEIADNVREQRIERRLIADGELRDPLLVGAVPAVEGFVLLDGTNRLNALKNLRIPLAMVQVVDYADEHAVQLRTWSHQGHVPYAEIIAGAGAIPGVEAVPIPALGVDDVLRRPQTLAVVLDHRNQSALIRDEDAPSRADQLQPLVDLYESTMVRVDMNPESVEEEAQNLRNESGPVTLVAFPPFSRSQVVTMATRRRLIPAGITRHIILCGRALRVDLPLEVLRESPDAATAERLLREHVSRLQPRLYQEPTILFDS